MQNDAYQEFLQANSRRSYPFVEDASLWDDGGTYELPNGLLLNFRGFTRQEPEDPEVRVQMVALVGPSATSLPGPFQVDGEGWVMVFRLGTRNQDTGTAQYLRVLIDSDIQGDQALHDALVGFVPSAFGQIQPVGDMANNGLTRHPVTGVADDYDYLAALIQVSVGDDAIDLMPADPSSRLYFSNALIEPGLFLNLWKTEIERLVVEDQCWQEADVTSSVIFRKGYNMQIVMLDDAIQLSPERGAGRGVQSITEFLAWDCSGGSSSIGSGSPYESSSGSMSPDERIAYALREACRDNILRVNGIGPDANHEFKIFGENGVTVQNFPNEHLIVINATVPTPMEVCPPRYPWESSESPE
jgi:hypothetical protein